jgi:hypothetical protein
MRWTKAKQLSGANFKRLLGVNKELFLKMVDIIKTTNPKSTHKIEGRKRGPKPKLNNYDKVLMLLMYYREYRTFAHIGATYNISEAQCWRIITAIESRLIKSPAFALAGKKKLLNSDRQWEVVVVDVSEHPIERPKKSSAGTTQAKRRDTL